MFHYFKADLRPLGWTHEEYEPGSYVLIVDPALTDIASGSPVPQIRSGFLCPKFLLSSQVTEDAVFPDGVAWRKT